MSSLSFVSVMSLLLLLFVSGIMEVYTATNPSKCSYVNYIWPVDKCLVFTASGTTVSRKLTCDSDTQAFSVTDYANANCKGESTPSDITSLLCGNGKAEQCNCVAKSDCSTMAAVFYDIGSDGNCVVDSQNSNELTFVLDMCTEASESTLSQRLQCDAKDDTLNINEYSEADCSDDGTPSALVAVLADYSLASWNIYTCLEECSFANQDKRPFFALVFSSIFALIAFLQF